MLKNNAHGGEVHPRVPSEREQGQLNVLEGEISRLIKAEISKLTQIYLGSNALVLEINRVLADTDEGAILAKVQEAKQLLEQNERGLEALRRDYRTTETRVQELKRFVETISARPNNEERNPQESMENELTSFLRSPNTPFSKERIIKASEILRRELREVSAIASRNEANADTKMELVKEMFEESTLIILGIKKSQETKLAHDAHQGLTRNKEIVEALVNGTTGLVGVVGREVTKSQGEIDRCVLALGEFQDKDIVEGNPRDLCTEIFRGVVLSLDDSKQITTELVLKSSKIERYFVNSKILLNIVRRHAKPSKRGKGARKDDENDGPSGSGSSTWKRFRKSTGLSVRRLRSIF
ncbi:hypothetical protein BEWA_027580 [Theileria equi strain WA]|uniref:Uncharacterized protein n=1 Tax=Theileria equi strain WA TaxID=1537102 RepID=L0AYF4_THEEQ|nr:hypothetical protein BEWA_027580 [Theileria equi strain WA]AFZ79909.1 hypothetical protein BEWA_027580 [Theileria equi strain WA]|eukprot:XP_004829575.1 hypothetical protein BEWA_027580 [Theileria equi strain WA]